MDTSVVPGAFADADAVVTPFLSANADIASTSESIVSQTPAAPLDPVDEIAFRNASRAHFDTALRSFAVLSAALDVASRGGAAEAGASAEEEEEDDCVGVPSLALPPLPPAPSFIAVSWPCLLPVPSLEVELSLLPFLLPGKPKLWKSPQFENRVFEHLPPKRQREIVSAASAKGMSLGQALSFRAAMLRSAAPFKFQDVGNVCNAAGARFEYAVERFLRAQRVDFVTQEELTAAALRAGRALGPTPDFLIRSTSRLFINGHRVYWIEVKRFFGTGIPNVKDWMPTKKMPTQLRKYAAAFGTGGAVVLRHGYGEGFRSAIDASVLLLDATPFEGDIDVELGVVSTFGLGVDVHVDHVTGKALGVPRAPATDALPQTAVTARK